MAWAQFIGRDLKSLKLKDLRDSVQLHELLFVLGADRDDEDDDADDGDITALRLAPGV